MRDIECTHDDPTVLAARGEGLLPITTLQGAVEAWNEGDLIGHIAIYDPTVTVMTKDGQIAGIDVTNHSGSSCHRGAILTLPGLRPARLRRPPSGRPRVRP